MLKVLDWTQKELRRIDPAVFSYLLSEWGEESAHTAQQCFMTERRFKSSFSHSSQWCRIYSGGLCIRIKIRKLVGKFSPRSHRLTARNPGTASRLRLGNTRKPMSVTGCLRMTQGKPWALRKICGRVQAFDTWRPDSNSGANFHVLTIITGE